jgi:hypothetical protein
MLSGYHSITDGLVEVKEGEIATAKYRAKYSEEKDPVIKRVDLKDIKNPLVIVNKVVTVK